MLDIAHSPHDLVRLHITPFNQDIYEKNILAAYRKTDTRVSFHAIQTFPERGFGYLEVSRSDAEALKRKLNGSILKGTKIRIEEARPIMKRKVDTLDDPVEESSSKKKRTRPEDVQKRPRDVVMLGHELADDRHVKRGWTEEKATGKKSKTGKSTTDKKLLFKTVLPANVAKPSKDESKKKHEKQKRKKSRREVVVEEFGKTRNTFVTSQASSEDPKPAVSYEDGLGWVDEDGVVVEPETKKQQRMHRLLEVSWNLPAGLKTSTAAQTTENDTNTSNDEAEGDTNTTDHEAEDLHTIETGMARAAESLWARFHNQAVIVERRDESNDEGDESNDDEDDEEDGLSQAANSLWARHLARAKEQSDDTEADSDTNEAPDTFMPDQNRIQAVSAEDNDESEAEEDSPSGGATSDAISSESGTSSGTEDSDDSDTTDKPEIHPLEALYKRSEDTTSAKNRLPPLNTSFSFFGGQDDEADSTTIAQPQTPHSKQDLDWRGQRSAAPTPDTAAIDRRFSFSMAQPDDDADEEDTATKLLAVSSQRQDSPQEESAFRKSFYEKRGDTDRAWKKRRREAKKLQRQRENRRLGRRIV